MMIKAERMNAGRLAEVLSFLGPLETLFNHSDPEMISAEVDRNAILIRNASTPNEIEKHIFFSHRDGYAWQRYREHIIRMLADHLALQEDEGPSLEAIHGDEIIFQLLRHYSDDFHRDLKRIRKRKTFENWKRSEDVLDGLPPQSSVGIHNNGLEMTLYELKIEDLSITVQGQMCIEADLPESIRQSAVGMKLNQIMSHPMLDPIDIDIIDLTSRGLIIKSKTTNALQQNHHHSSFSRAQAKVEQWEADWNSGKDLTPWS